MEGRSSKDRKEIKKRKGVSHGVTTNKQKLLWVALLREKENTLIGRNRKKQVTLGINT